MLTPMVPTREVYFVRYSKQISADQWAIVDVSIDKVEDSVDASLTKCRKRPSGCIIEDKSNGHCKVIFLNQVSESDTGLILLNHLKINQTSIIVPVDLFYMVSQVTWVEHLECQKSTVHSLYRAVVNSGLAFGARHWMTTLQLQCERLAFFMATNVPTKDSSGTSESLMPLFEFFT